MSTDSRTNAELVDALRELARVLAAMWPDDARVKAYVQQHAALMAELAARTERGATELAEAQRKVEAYDVARAVVKREGHSRAEYVLRAKAAEAALAEAREKLGRLRASVSRGRALIDPRYENRQDVLAWYEDSAALATPEQAGITDPDHEEGSIGTSRNLERVVAEQASTPPERGEA